DGDVLPDHAPRAVQHHAVELNRRRGRHAQCRGQVLPITMVFATLLLGAVALAVDLSLQTHQRRSAQNVTDAAALAGATDLGATQSQAQRRTAVTDSLRIVHDRIGMSGGGTTWATGLLSAQ